MYAIALDMGGTKISGCLITENGKIISSSRVPTRAEKGKTVVLENLVSVIKGLKEGSKHKIAGVGISMPGFVDSAGKIVFTGGNIHCLKGVQLKKILQQRTKLPVFIENDANCFALAEAVYGAGKQHSVVVGIIWGTGIGGGIVQNKKIFSGSFGGAGEFGHIIVAPEHGKKGSVELLASGKNVVKQYKKFGGKLKVHTTGLYAVREPAARRAITEMIHYLGLGLAGLVNTLNPDVIVLGGGVSNSPEKIYERLRREVKKFVVPELGKSLKIVKHKISDDAGLYGAAALVFNQ